MRLWLFLNCFAASALFFGAAVAYAQDADSDLTEIIDETDEPAITIRKPDVNAEITERRNGGMVEEIKISNGSNTYYLYPNGKNGALDSFEREIVRPALWKVGEFDVTDRKKSIEGEGGLTNDEVAPPSE